MVSCSFPARTGQDMSPAEQAPPEGALIRLARKARGLSVKKAVELVRDRAPDIRLGESRWYHLEGGTEGKDRAVVAREDTLAHMAFVLGLTPERLTEVGRDDAAEILAEIIRQNEAEASRQPAKQADPELHRLLALWPRLAEWQRRSLAGIAQEMLGDGKGESRTRSPQEAERRTG